MFSKKNETINFYQFKGENKSEYSLSLKNKFLNLILINQKFIIMKPNSIPYDITTIFSAKEFNFDLNEIFIIQLIGYIESDELLCFYENYEDIFLFLMNIKAKLTIPPTDNQNEFVNNLECKKKFCILIKNNKFFLIFSKQISKLLPFEINTYNKDDCFYFAEITNKDVIFFISKKFNELNINVDLNENLNDKIYQLLKAKITMFKEQLKKNSEFENNLLNKKKNIDDLKLINEQNQKQIQELKSEIINISSKDYKIEKLENEKQDLILQLKEEKNKKISTKFQNNKIIKSKLQEMFIPSEYEVEKDNNIRDINTNSINIDETDDNFEKYTCGICYKNERDIFFKQCGHIYICQDCCLVMAKNEILSKNKKKKESEDILNKRLLNQLKNGKIKVKCPICKNETLCYLCKFS